MNLHILVHASDNIEEKTMNEVTELDVNQIDCEKNDCPQCYQAFTERRELITHVSKHGQKVQRWSDKNVERKSDSKESQVSIGQWVQAQ